MPGRQETATPRDSSTYFRSLYLTQWEDGLLTAGGLVGALSSTLTADLSTSLVVAALSIAALGKAVPSLIAQGWWTPPGPFPPPAVTGGRKSHWLPSQSSDDHPNIRDAWTIVGDSFLLILAAAAILAYLWPYGSSLKWFLVLLGLAFTSEALVSLAEQASLSKWLDKDSNLTVTSKPAERKAHSKPTPSAALGSRTIEGVLLLTFGLSAVILTLSAGSAATAGSALGLAALGKALPSFLAAASTAGTSGGQ